ncbi:MAG: Omp28-related outer membrane protein [Duncaniella sp.]|nr:Omp28-related outer membrane protein [Duncaniella sp.]
MKKQILALAALCVGIAASASGFTLSDKMKLNPERITGFKSVEAPVTVAPVKSPAKAESQSDMPEIYYTLAGDPSNAFALQTQSPGMQLAMAFQFEPSFIENVTEGEITGITYYTGCETTNQSVNRITKAYVFITDDLTSEDFLYTQEVTAPNTPFTKVDVKLDQPFSLLKNDGNEKKKYEKLYCGVYFNLNSENNAALVVDYTGHPNDYGGWYAVRMSSKAKWTWKNAAKEIGFMTVGATIRANGMPENEVSVVAIAGQPVAYEKQPVPFQFLVQNNGVNPVETITVELGVDTESPLVETFQLQQPLGFNQMLLGTIEQYAAQYPAKSANLAMKVTEVNGVANKSANGAGSFPVVIVPEGRGLDRNVVIEEFTSTSCSFCPVGYTAMEQIHEDCTDGSIIPVCIHVNYPGRDPMVAASYNNVYNYYCTDGVPSTVVNRSYDQYPYYDELITLANEIKALPGIAAVDAEATIEEGTRNLTVNTKTTFSFDYTDGDENFILAYGITEDNVGPYTQSNGYSGESGTYPGNWQNQPATVQLVYNDVARQLDRYTGITGSIPSQIVYGEEYEFSHTLSLLNSIDDLSNIHIVVYLLNRKTGAIENACVVKSPVEGDSGIDTVIADDTDAPVEYFNLQGIRVNDPSTGLYIRRQGDKVTKVLVR